MSKNLLGIKIPKFIKTSEVALRWGKSAKQVVRILKKEDARKVQFADTLNASFSWVLSDVERIEQKVFGHIFS